GVANFVSRAEKDGVLVPAGLKSIDRFYKYENGKNYFYSIPDKAYKEISRRPDHISLSFLKKTGAEVEKNSGASVIDLGDGIFCLEFHTKMNAIGSETLSMVHKAIKRAEDEGIGLVI